MALVGGALYLIGTYKLCKLIFVNKLILSLSLLLLVINPFVIDFFSLARGYSLALGFLMLSLFYFFKTYATTDARQVFNFRIKSFCLMSLAVIANFSFLNVYLALIGSYFIIEFISIYLLKDEKASTNVFLRNLCYIIIIITVCLSALIFSPLSKITKYNLLYGGKIGFFHDTVGSLIQSSLYGKEYFSSSFDKYFIFVLIFLSILFVINVICLFYQKDKVNDKTLIAISLLVGISALSIIFQNIFLSTPFILARAAIYFIPLFTLFILIFWNSILRNTFWIRTISNAILTFCSVIILFHYLFCINLSHTFDWRYDASTRVVMDRIFEIEQIIQPKAEMDQFTIGATWWLVPAIDYYLLKHGGRYKLVEPRGPETLAGPDGQYDFYYLDRCDQRILTKYQLTLINHYGVSDTYLGATSSLISK